MVVHEPLREILLEGTLLALAGEQYSIAVHHSRWPVEIPMKGLGNGQQLGWLTEKLSANIQYKAVIFFGDPAAAIEAADCITTRQRARPK